MVCGVCDVSVCVCVVLGVGIVGWGADGLCGRDGWVAVVVVVAFAMGRASLQGNGRS